MQMLVDQNQYLDELKLEVDGVQYSSTASDNKQSSSKGTEARESEPDLQQIVQDYANRSTVVMSRRKRGMYEAMQVNLSIMLLVLLYDKKKVCFEVRMPWTNYLLS
jgi:pescadillo protein